MKTAVRIFMYNMLTVIFALLTIVSLGSAGGEVSFLTAAGNSAVFGLLTYYCRRSENRLRHAAASVTAGKAAGLSVYGNMPKNAA